MASPQTLPPRSLTYPDKDGDRILTLADGCWCYVYADPLGEARPRLYSAYIELGPQLTDLTYREMEKIRVLRGREREAYIAGLEQARSARSTEPVELPAGCVSAPDDDGDRILVLPSGRWCWLYLGGDEDGDTRGPLRSPPTHRLPVHLRDLDGIDCAQLMNLGPHARERRIAEIEHERYLAGLPAVKATIEPGSHHMPGSMAGWNPCAEVSIPEGVAGSVGLAAWWVEGLVYDHAGWGWALRLRGSTTPAGDASLVKAGAWLVPISPPANGAFLAPGAGDLSLIANDLREQALRAAVQATTVDPLQNPHLILSTSAELFAARDQLSKRPSADAMTREEALASITVVKSDGTVLPYAEWAANPTYPCTMTLEAVGRCAEVKISETVEPADDPVKRPNHYQLPGDREAHDDVIAPICDALAERGLRGREIYDIGAALKYLARAGAKDSTLRDLQKAREYLERAIKSVAGQG